MANTDGRVVQVLGGVVDVEFPEGDVPGLFEAIEVERMDQEPLVLEVQKHLGDNWVRTVNRWSAAWSPRPSDGTPYHGTGWRGNIRSHL